MLQFVGMDFFSGPDALNPAPSAVPNITSTELRNGIFDHLNLSYDTKLFGDTSIPTEWTYDTVLNAGFNGDAGAGNLEYAIKYVDSIKIKRRIKPGAKVLNTSEQKWITLFDQKIETVEDLSFTFNDFLNAWGAEYDYALVPVVNGVEGRYIIASLLSKFNGVFIGDAEQSFKFLYEVSYGSNARKHQTGVFTPLGKQYPIIVANGVLSYESGSVSALVIDDGFEKTGVVDKDATVKKKTRLKNFLTNKKPKVLKDWNGNIWLVIVTDDVPIEYKEDSAMSIPKVTFNWSEIGDINSQDDLYNAGLIDALD